MIFLAFLFWAFAGFSLQIELVLGWAERPVLEAVNPLWVTLTNPQPTPLVGELRLTMEFGSPWRGMGTYSATLPVAVAGLGKTRLLLPWPVQVGSSRLRAAVFAEGKNLGERELVFTPELEPLRAGLGPPAPSLDLFLSPAELPPDPLLLSPFSELRPLLPLSGWAEEVVRAWASFLSGEVRVDGEAWRSHLAGIRPPSPDWSLLFPGLFLYVLCLVVLLPGLAQGRPQLALALLLSFLALALFYSVSRESAPRKQLVFVRIQRPGFTSFSLELCGIAPWTREEEKLAGWWVELLPPAGWQGRDLRWRFTGETWETVLKLEPGRPRLLLRVSAEPSPPSEETRPPSWLTRALSLPWERARVRRVPEHVVPWETYVIEWP